jgi:hypothetical protein
MPRFKAFAAALLAGGALLRHQAMGCSPSATPASAAIVRAIDVARECQNQGSPLLKRIELGLHLLGQTRANQFVGCC